MNISPIALPRIQGLPEKEKGQKVAEEFVTSFFTQWVQLMMDSTFEDKFAEEMFSSFLSESIAAKISPTYVGQSLTQAIVKKILPYQNPPKEVLHGLSKDF